MTFVHTPGGQAPAVSAAMAQRRWPHTAVAAVPRRPAVAAVPRRPAADTPDARAGEVQTQLAAARFRSLLPDPPREPTDPAAAAAASSGFPLTMPPGPVVPAGTGSGRRREPAVRPGRWREPPTRLASKLVVPGCRNRPDSRPAAGQRPGR